MNFFSFFIFAVIIVVYYLYRSYQIHVRIVLKGLEPEGITDLVLLGLVSFWGITGHLGQIITEMDFKDIINKMKGK